jgi:hypothetical protein
VAILNAVLPDARKLSRQGSQRVINSNHKLYKPAVMIDQGTERSGLYSANDCCSFVPWPKAARAVLRDYATEAKQRP